MRPTNLPLNKIRLDGDAQARLAVDDTTVIEYAELMSDEVKLPPIEVYHDGSDYWPWDGFHRIGACKKLGRKAIAAIVRPGTRDEAQWQALQANKHGKPLTSADRVNALKKALTLHPEMTDRAIAGHVGVRPETAAKYRRDLEAAGTIRKADSRVTSDGRTINTANIGKTAASVPGDAEPDVDAIPFDAPATTKPAAAEEPSPAPDEVTAAEAAAESDEETGAREDGYDFENNKLSPSIAADFARRGEINDLLAKLQEVKAAVERAVREKDPLFAEVNETTFAGDWKVVYRSLSMIRPYAVCPWCAGDGCMSCHRRGWVSKPVYSRRPTELR